MLSSLAGDMPIPMLVDSYNRWASANRFRKRTQRAIVQHATTLGVNIEVCGAWITSGILIRALGRRAEKWIETKELLAHMIGCRRFIKRSDLRSFAKKHPERFRGLPLGELVMILDSVPLAEYLIAQGAGPRPGYGRKVVCLETGKVYPSLASAARAHFIHKTTVGKSIRLGRPCICGRTFAYAC
jgi:hypothetical protein